MGIWSSIRDFYRKWKPEIDLYGIGFLLIISALLTNRMLAAGIVFVGMFTLDAMRRWGEPWRQIGEKEWERRRLANQQLWKERMEELFSRFKDEPPLPTTTTHLIPRPERSELEPDLPESPAPILEPKNSLPPVAPPVTHDT